MKHLYLTLVGMLGLGLAAQAQNIVTSSPTPLQENSENVVITYHADQGNKALMGLPSTTAVYAHTGVITNKSTSGSDWKYAPTWLDNSEKYKLEYVAENTYELTIGDIRTYYGITNADEKVEKLAFVFRTADGGKQGKTATGGDIFLDVMAEGFQLDFSSNASTVLNSTTATVTFTANTTASADIKIYLGDTNSVPIAEANGVTTLSTEYTFVQGDSYDVIAVATNGTDTAEQSIHICYPGDSQEVAYPGGTPAMGATAEANGDVTFCLAAPGKTNVMIMPSWDGYAAMSKNVMNYTDIDGIRYFWLTVSGLDPDTDYLYYYLVDEATPVGDPYARLVLDPYSDKWLADGVYPGMPAYPYDVVQNNAMIAVYRGTFDNYDWRIQDFQGVDKSELVIYELLFRDFTGTEGKADGNGTVKLAMDKLDYLEALGINAIEMMPICEFNGNNSWGYNTNFYFAPDKAYGSPDDYRAFIDECHSRGIAVILDVVFNQSDGLHPWYQMYSSGSNPFYNATAPHAYSVLNDWKQDNMLVQQQWQDMIRYWMTAYKIDGFRFDLVKGLGDNDSYGGNNSEANTNKYNASRVERMKTLTDVMFSINPNAYSINENLATAQEENDMAANGQLNWANINDAACQFAMGYVSDSNCNRFYAPQDSRTWGSTVSYAESHDEQRVAYKQETWGVDGVKGDLAVEMRRCGGVAAQMLLSPGAHMIWQFGELGNDTNTKNSDWSNNTDPKPVLWSYYDVPDRRGLYDNYQELIALRRDNPDLFAENANFTIQCAVSNWTKGRYIYASTDDKELICVINPNLTETTFTDVTFKQADNSAYKAGSQSYGVDYSFDAAAGTVTLAGSSYVVLVNDKVGGISSVVTDENVEVRYFNLQGLEVANPQPGHIYIRVAGNQATKILAR
ncbi:MAG: hypothetical protein LIP09_10640 [Bacteroidales bacterium]|nr:hypothetical protein [Bacteroidales bacterium]